MGISSGKLKFFECDCYKKVVANRCFAVFSKNAYILLVVLK